MKIFDHLQCRKLRLSGQIIPFKCGPAKRRGLRNRPSSSRSAVRALGIALTDHATLPARPKAAVAKIEAGMAWAQRTGVLHEFNQGYRRWWLEAQRRGERFHAVRAGDSATAARDHQGGGHWYRACGDRDVALSPLTPVALANDPGRVRVSATSGSPGSFHASWRSLYAAGADLLIRGAEVV
jgi:hypothetical protein